MFILYNINIINICATRERREREGEAEMVKYWDTRAIVGNI